MLFCFFQLDLQTGKISFCLYTVNKKMMADKFQFFMKGKSLPKPDQGRRAPAEGWQTGTGRWHNCGRRQGDERVRQRVGKPPAPSEAAPGNMEDFY